MTESTKSSNEYMKLPYSRVLIRDSETGTFTALLQEFPGCIAQGNTPAEAYENLEEAARSWVEVALAMGQEIPAPTSVSEYSGKVALRLPKSLHRQAVVMAEREGTSLNQLIVTAVAEKLGASKLYDKLVQNIEDHFLARAMTSVSSFAVGLLSDVRLRTDRAENTVILGTQKSAPSVPKA